MFYMNSNQALAQENNVMTGGIILRVETDLRRINLG